MPRSILRQVLAAQALILGSTACGLLGEHPNQTVETSALEHGVESVDGLGRLTPPSTWPGFERLVTRYASTTQSRPSPASEDAISATLPHTATVVESRKLALEDTLGAASARAGLDVLSFQGRVYLVVRSLPLGKSDSVPRIDVVSSGDEHSWQSELSKTSEAELYAPRLMQWDGRLFAYVSELEKVAGRFQPRAVFASELGNSGVWKGWTQLELDAQVVWRAKVERGVPLMTSYALGEKTYEFDEPPLEVHLLTTSDGYRWKNLESGRRAVYRGAGSETAFTSDDDGNLYTLVRNEASSQAGFGSAICSARAADWADWDCVRDPKKYDSPTLFNHDGELYLVARRHAAKPGPEEAKGSFSLLRRIERQAEDLAAPKRCTLWHYNRSHKRVEFVLDLPSKGNTCSPAVMPGKKPGEFVIYDHSSDVNGPELSLAEGLTRPTYVYRHVIRLE